jgi:hypothetical protein
VDRPWARYQEKRAGRCAPCSTIQPVESRAAFTEAGVNSSQVKRGTKVRLHEVLEMVKSTQADTSSRSDGQPDAPFTIGSNLTFLILSG